MQRKIKRDVPVAVQIVRNPIGCVAHEQGSAVVNPSCPFAFGMGNWAFAFGMGNWAFAQ